MSLLQIGIAICSVMIACVSSTDGIYEKALLMDTPTQPLLNLGWNDSLCPTTAEFSSITECQQNIFANSTIAGGMSDVTEHDLAFYWEHVEDMLWGYDTFKTKWGDLNNYEFLEVLGEGEYSVVTHVIDRRTGRDAVVKVLKPVERYRVKREIKILQDLVGGPSIIGFLEVAKNYTDGTVAIVTEYVNNSYYRPIYESFNDLDVRYYMFQLLRAIEHAHKLNIFHRDIKPHNIAIDHQNRKLRLLDWGVADYFDENYAYTIGVGSKYWRAPEILVEYRWYNLSMDIWSFGCMLAALVFNKEPFWRGRGSDISQLIKVSQTLGSEDLFAWMEKYDITLGEEMDPITGWYKRWDWKDGVNWYDDTRVSDDALDLLSKLLVYDHHERITATQALEHPYFDPIRSWVELDSNTSTPETASP